ncbi:hypothetical protein THIX_60589 [Thiomonas sp. X19]|nr:MULTISPECIES: type II toxin-antitoxin system RelE/ParE family toxin [Thiomonas]CDW96208.1 hypothetical protein THICB2_760034 [Thiomonas sp. CB2]CQR45676.1 hypothetical protein THICB370030 [Thiomonas sp. CB3]SCC94531.1 hypothetical protein THIX_60589 [Thiomonas sp. X19]VDY11104.1 protein of unknown function [Thiomonas sp. Sup16B3]VDY11354.1 protein of unknown function [Thiomonas sp. Bio17B3]
MLPEGRWSASPSSPRRYPSIPLYKIIDWFAQPREMVVHPTYIVFYRVTATSIDMLAVTHARRQSPA